MKQEFDNMFECYERKIEFTSEAQGAGIFDLVWERWRQTRQYRLEEDDTYTQIPLSRGAFPDGREDCGVFLQESRLSDGAGNWSGEGYLLSLEWTDNIKSGCREGIDDCLATAAVNNNGTSNDLRLSGIQQECVRNCILRLSATPWVGIY